VATIRIDPSYIGDLEQRCREIHGTLDGVGFAHERLDGAPEVLAALDGFHDRWEKTRAELSTALESLAHAFQAVREGFEVTDRELSAVLEPSGTPQGSGGAGGRGGGR
jgi:hypothetical protein